MTESTEVILRLIVKGGDQLQRLVNSLTSVYGRGTEVDMFQEELVFKPIQERGNMNYVNRDVLVELEYSGGGVVVKHIGSSLTELKDLPVGARAFNVVKTSVSEGNIRRLFLKSGFILKSDFAKKGIRFISRTGLTICLSRPYNASLGLDQTYMTGITCWETLTGPFPLGQDYLLEISGNTKYQAGAEDLVREINALREQFGEYIQN